MNSKIEDYSTIAKQLKNNYPKLSEFEALSLAIQIERNQILENGLVVSKSDKTRSGLEAIGIALGFTEKQTQNTIVDVLSEMSQKK